MFIWEWVGNEKIVNLHENEMEVIENTIHKHLKRMAGLFVDETENVESFKETKRCDDGCLWNIWYIWGLHRYSVVSSNKIKISGNWFSQQIRREIIGIGYQSGLRRLLKCPKISTRMPKSRCFFGTKCNGEN